MSCFTDFKLARVVAPLPSYGGGIDSVVLFPLPVSRHQMAHMELRMLAGLLGFEYG